MHSLGTIVNLGLFPAKQGTPLFFNKPEVRALEHWRLESGGWNIRAREQYRLQRDGSKSYSCRPLHFEALDDLYDGMHAAQRQILLLSGKENNMSTL